MSKADLKSKVWEEEVVLTAMTLSVKQSEEKAYSLQNETKLLQNSGEELGRSHCEKGPDGKEYGI